MKGRNRSFSISPWSLALALAVSTYGCGSGAQDPQSTGHQSAALLGTMSFESSCQPADIPDIQLSYRYARIAANSPAFAECIRLTFAQNMVLNQDNDYTDGPYIPCASDPPTPDANTILTSTRTANPTDFACDYSKIGTSTGAYAGIGGVPATDPTALERITMGAALGDFRNTTGPCFRGNPGACVSDSTYGDVGAAIYHEARHQHGYDHMEIASPTNYLCGIDSSKNPQYANSVPRSRTPLENDAATTKARGSPRRN